MMYGRAKGRRADGRRRHDQSDEPTRLRKRIITICYTHSLGVLNAIQVRPNNLLPVLHDTATARTDITRFRRCIM